MPTRRPPIGPLAALEPRVNPGLFGPAVAYRDLNPDADGFDDPLAIDVAVADFNGDGAADLASVRLTGDVTVFLNDGSGRFAARAYLPSGSTTRTYGTTLAAGDFNGDGRQDLAVFGNRAGETGQRLRVSRGDGAGGFDGGTVVVGATDAYLLRVADLNADGADDLITHGPGSHGVAVMLGDRAGTVQPPTQYARIGGRPVLGFAAGDFTGDGRPDVATLTLGGAVEVYAGTGAGELVLPATSSPVLTAGQVGTGFLTGVGSIAAGDFTGDGKLDLVALGFEGGRARGLVFAAGRGDGTFAAPVTAATGFSAFFGPRVADFNGDGKLDATFSNSTVGLPGMPEHDPTAKGAVTFLGDGAGGFVRVNDDVDRGGLVNGLAAGDFDRDGRSDLVVADGAEGVRVLTAVAAPAGPLAAVGAASGGFAQIALATGQPRLRLGDPELESSGSVRTATADVTGDGVPDLVLGAGPGAPARVLVLDGVDGEEVARFEAFSGFTGGVFVAVGDIDGDGKAEVIATPDQGGGPIVALYSGAKLAAGQVGDAAQIVRFFGIQDKAFRGGARPALGDVNGDGAADLAISAGFLGGPRIALFSGRQLVTRVSEYATSGDPDGSFRLVGDFFAFEDGLRNGAFVALGDVTGDGRAELAFGAGPGGAPRVRVFDGARFLTAGAFTKLDQIEGSAQSANFFAGGDAPRGGVRVALRDADADGRADLLTGSGEGEAPRVRVYVGSALAANPAGPTAREFDPFGGAVTPNGIFVG